MAHLRKIIAMALLSVGLFAAAAAACCADCMPTHDCCPTQSPPTGGPSCESGSPSGTPGCCVAETQSAAAIASVAPIKVDIQPMRADPPAAISSFPVALGIIDAAAQLSCVLFHM